MATKPTVTWKTSAGSDLSASELYELLALRTDVFVVEQNCAYAELDHRDLGSDIFHIQGFVANDPQIAAVVRLMYDDQVPKETVQIGRVVVRQNCRKLGLGRQALQAALNAVASLQNQFPCTKAVLHGQSHLRRFYESFGFQVVGSEFLEDGIPHYEMAKEL